MKFTTISKISNTSQLLIIPFLSIHYITSDLKYQYVKREFRLTLGLKVPLFLYDFNQTGMYRKL
jgi:hypothetical protein